MTIFLPGSNFGLDRKFLTTFKIHIPYWVFRLHDGVEVTLVIGIHCWCFASVYARCCWQSPSWSSFPPPYWPWAVHRLCLLNCERNQNVQIPKNKLINKRVCVDSWVICKMVPIYKVVLRKTGDILCVYKYVLDVKLWSSTEFLIVKKNLKHPISCKSCHLKKAFRNNNFDFSKINFWTKMNLARYSYFGLRN